MNEANFFDDMRYSKIPSLDPDPKEFPLFYKAKKYEFRLNPGERLFIPSGWFHLIDSSELDPEEKLEYLTSNEIYDSSLLDSSSCSLS